MRWEWPSARPHNRRRCAAAIAAALVLAGCYRYAPIATSRLETGAVVRLDLSSTGTTRLASVLGQGTSAVEGTVLAATDTGYRMSVTGTRKVSTPGLLTWGGEQITVPRDVVERVQLRSLDRKRTLGVAALAVLAGVALKVLLNAFDSSASGDDGGGVVTPP